MDKRRDALAGAAKLALEIREIAARVGDGAVCTSGGVVCQPGIVTSVVETAEQLLDQRHLDAASLARAPARRRRRRASASPPRRTSRSSWERIWIIEPILFDRRADRLLRRGLREVAGVSHRLPSGPLHDAAEVARAGVPTVMMFVQSLRGLSHTKLEDTREEHLELSVAALDRLADEDDRLGRRRRRSLSRPRSTIAARCSCSAAAVTWNISNVGAVADLLGASYGVSLAAVGLLTTALFVTHLAVQMPGGRLIDRVGARGVALAALAVVAASGTRSLLIDAVARLGARRDASSMGVGTGAGFVAGHRPRPRGRRAARSGRAPTAAPRWPAAGSR